MKSLFPQLGVIHVSGDDAASFLHNQLSNDVLNLPEQNACFATYNSAQGRVTSTMIVIRKASEFLLITSSDLLETLTSRLQMFILRSKVKLSISDNLAIAISLPDNERNLDLSCDEPLCFPYEIDVSGCLKLKMLHNGILLIGDKDKLPAYNQNIARQFEWLNIKNGLAMIDASTSNTCVAQMLNLHKLGAINFKKGCYPGQEVIAKAQYRTNVKRGLALLKSNQSENNGTNITNANNESVGLVINHINEHLLCVIKHEAVKQDLYIQQKKLKLEKTFFQAT